jgi:Glycosyl transferases group 1
MGGKPSVLVSWYTDPRVIPPFILAPGQVTVGPKVNPDQPRLMLAGRTPIGVYDLKVALESQRLPTRYDLIVVYADASGMNFPLNLAAFDCPKVLLMGDTHHLKDPLRQVVEYARDACFDAIVSMYNRQHLHWLRAAGFARVAWFPGLAVRHVPRPFHADRKQQIGFVGQASSRHVRRSRLIDLLRSSGVPIAAMTGTREATADLYAESIASFNASLNGDLNLRTFEVLSAGGCLLTDRLSPESGLSLLLEEGTHYYGYDTPEELIEKAGYLLQHPETALETARAGSAAFLASMLPNKRASDLLAWALEDRLDDLYRVPADRPTDTAIDLMDRLRIYEALQQVHLEKERPRVVFDPAVPQVYRSDATDLRRLDVVVAPPDAGTGPWDAVVSAGPHGVGCTRPDPADRGPARS